MTNLEIASKASQMNEIGFDQLGSKYNINLSSYVKDEEQVFLTTYGFYKPLFSNAILLSYIVTNLRILCYVQDLSKKDNAPTSIDLKSILGMKAGQGTLTVHYFLDIDYSGQTNAHSNLLLRLGFGDNQKLRDKFNSTVSNLRNRSQENNSSSSDLVTPVQSLGVNPLLVEKELTLYEKIEKDKKLNHVNFTNVWYFDPEDQKEYMANLDLFGYSYELTTFLGGKPQKKIGGNFEGDFEMRYRIISFNQLYVSLDLFDNQAGDYLRMSHLDFPRLKAHYATLNSKFIELELKQTKNILSDVSRLQNDQELMHMAMNYLNEVYQIYLNPINLIGIECIIENKGHACPSIFLSDEFQRSAVSKIEQIAISEYQTQLLFIVENKEILDPYMEDYFYQFSNLIQMRFDLPDNHYADNLAHLFLYRSAINFCCQKFSKDYSKFFPDIDNLNLSDAIERYCKIETINPKDPHILGVFIYYLIASGKFESDNYIKCFNSFSDFLNTFLEKTKLQNFANRLKLTTSSETPKFYSIDQVDLMTGQEFEKFIADLFRRMGYETEVTKGSGDQGVDVIATKEGNRIGIQAKCYSGNVSNSAVQEAVAGKSFYHLDRVMVITNSSFTTAAQTLAAANEVVLWDRTILKEKIVQYSAS